MILRIEETAMDKIDSTEDANSKQRGRPFPPGKSGNPNGRPRGSRNHATLAAEALLEGEAEGITRKLIDKALEGDMTALRMCLDRLVAPRRERCISFELPKIETAADAANASAALIAECAAGNVSSSEATEIMALISSHVRVLEVMELEARVIALEKERLA
jgi:uncharacterized protein DUF5681